MAAAGQKFAVADRNRASCSPLSGFPGSSDEAKCVATPSSRSAGSEEILSISAGKFARINPRPIQPGIDHHLHVGPLPPVLRDSRQVLRRRAAMRSTAPTHAGTPPPASPAGCPDRHSRPAAAPSPADRTPSVAAASSISATASASTIGGSAFPAGEIAQRIHHDVRVVPIRVRLHHRADFHLRSDRPANQPNVMKDCRPGYQASRLAKRISSHPCE